MLVLAISRLAKGSDHALDAGRKTQFRMPRTSLAKSRRISHHPHRLIAAVRTLSPSQQARGLAEEMGCNLTHLPDADGQAGADIVSGQRLEACAPGGGHQGVGNILHVNEIALLFTAGEFDGTILFESLKDGRQQPVRALTGSEDVEDAQRDE